MARHAFHRICPIAIAVLVIAALLAPAAQAAATLSIVQGSGDIQSLQTAIGVEDPQVVTLQWTTDEAGAAGGTWTVTTGSGANLKTVATGDAGTAPAVGHFARFTIPTNGQPNGPGGFLQNQPIAAQVAYSITVQPYDKQHNAVGAASPDVTVTQAPKTPPTNPFQNAANANYPEIVLLHYVEKVGVVPQTQLHFAEAALTLRFINASNKATDPVIASAFDNNQLMRATAPVKVDKLAKHDDFVDKTISMKAILPPPTSQLPEDKQYTEWEHAYETACGVDLRVALDFGGNLSNAPLNDHQLINNVYQGYGSSQPWEEGTPLATDRLCDDANCWSLNKVAQSICRQLRNKVVGYAFYIGNKAVHRMGAYGKAKTAADPPAKDFQPYTKMQIASASKVLTGLATVRQMKDLESGATIDNTIFNALPADWQTKLPPGHLVRAITFRELVSQKSGVQQYYASANGQDYASLQQFFTQALPNPNAAPTCPGPPHPATPNGPAVPQNLPNPIVSNKTACYTDTNFGMMRVLLPRAGGNSSTDPLALGQAYVKIVQDTVLKPVGASASCAPPVDGNLAFPYTLNAATPGWDWGDLTTKCGDWGWYLSVADYGAVLSSLNAGDGKILTQCQFNDVELNPELDLVNHVEADHAVGFDTRSDGTYRWLEKNGADSWSQNGRAGTQTTTVAIFGGRNGCGSTKPTPGVVGVLFINSPILNSTSGADTVLLNAFHAAVGPK